MNKNMNFLEEWDVIIPSDYYPDNLVLHSDIHTAIVHDIKEDEPSNNMEAPFTKDFNFINFLIARNSKQFHEKQAVSATTQSANTREDEKKKIHTECGSSAKMIEIGSHIKSEQDQDTAKPETATKDTSSSRDIDEYFGDRYETASGCFIPTTLTISSSIELEKSSSTSSEESVTSSETYFSIPSDPEEFKDKPKNSESSYHDPKNDSADDTDQSASTCVNFWYNRTAFCLKCCLNNSFIKLSILMAVSLTVSLISVNEIYKNSIITLLQEENVSLTMQKMRNELWNDYKLLKEQMLSEMKNDKLVSSITHQIRELKKENYKLKFALYEVVNKIEKQKYSQEKLLEKNENIHDPPTKIDDWSPIIQMFLVFYVYIICMCIFCY